MSADEFPTVEAAPSKDGRVCTVRCPFCGRTHTHGLPDGPDDARSYGHRGSHCHSPGGTYLLVPVPRR